MEKMRECPMQIGMMMMMLFFINQTDQLSIKKKLLNKNFQFIIFINFSKIMR